MLETVPFIIKLKIHASIGSSAATGEIMIFFNKVKQNTISSIGFYELIYFGYTYAYFFVFLVILW